MSIRAASRGLGSCLSASSSNLRTRILDKPTRCKRCFSSTPPRKGLPDVVIWAPTQILNVLHATGLPWWVVIPTTAIAARAAASHIGAEKRRRQQSLLPVLAPLIQAKTFAEFNHQSTSSSRDAKMFARNQGSLQARVNRALTFLKIRKQTLMQFDVPRGIQWLNFGILLAFSEAIRRKCSDREGLLSFLLRPFSWIKDTFVVPVWEYATGLSAAESEGVHPGPDIVVAQPNVAATAAPGQEVADAAATRFDPTLCLEGIPGWCENLTIPDPTLVLPTALGLCMAAPILIRRYRGQKQSFSDKGFLTAALLYVPIGMSMPSAILLYLVSSFGTGLLQNHVLQRRRTFAGIKGCKQPLRAKERKEWSDFSV